MRQDRRQGRAAGAGFRPARKFRLGKWLCLTVLTLIGLLLGVGPALGGVSGTYDLVLTSHNLPIIVSESDGTVTLTFDLVFSGLCDGTWGPVDWNVGMDFSAGQASGADVGSPMPSSMMFSSTLTSVDVVVPIVNDGLVEMDELFEISLTPTQSFAFCSSPAGGIDANRFDYRFQMIIQDDDGVPPVELSIFDTTVKEGDFGNSTATLTLQMANGPIGQDVSVDWVTDEFTALLNDNDFLFGSGTATIPAGQTQTTLDVTVVGDTDIEPDEVFLVNLLTPSRGILADGQAKVYIVNDDFPTPQVKVRDTEVVEGNGDGRNMAFLVEVEIPDGGRPAARGVAIPSVEYRTKDLTAVADADYKPVQGVLTFEDAGTKVVQVPIVGDLVDEIDERLVLELFNPIGVDLVDDQGIGIILDDDQTAPKINILDAELVEGDDGQADMGFEVSLSPAQATTVQVSYETVAGSATADEDYLSQSGVLVFDPGVTTRSLAVPVLGDTDSEGDESFTVRLFDAGGVELDDGATGTILDDDAPLPQITTGDVTVDESDGSADVLLRLSSAADGEVTVEFSTADGSATAGSDYTASSGTASFPPGTVETTVSIAILNDDETEQAETFTVQLGNPVGAVLADGEGATVTIEDDDGETPPPSLSIGDIEITEGDAGTTTARFPLTLSRTAESRVTVDFSTRDGTALVADGDYEAGSGRVEIAVGQSTAFVDVSVQGDNRDEDDETFFVDLLSVDGATVADGEGQGLIVDDDQGGGGGGGNGGAVRLIQPEPAMEGDGPALIQVERFAGASGAASVLVTSAPGTADNGTDFEPVSVRVLWADGESGPKSVEIPILNDSVQEETETFSVSIQAPQVVILNAPINVTVEIVDDDTPMVLEAIGDLEREATVREEETFQVRVTKDNGEPVSGAVVRWSVDGAAELAGDGGRTQSGDDGLVSQKVLYAARPGTADIAATLVGSDAAVTFKVMVRGNLGTGGGDGGGGAQEDEGVAETLDDSCAESGDGRYDKLCDYIFEQAGDDPVEVVESLTPRAALSQARTALRAPTHQTRNITSRLSALRSGKRGVAVDQLAFMLGGDTVQVGMVQQAVRQYSSDGDLFADALASALSRGNRARGNRARGNGLEAPWAPMDDEDVGSGEDTGSETETAHEALDSPWGFFANGRLSFGDAPRRGEDLAYEFSTQGLTFGVDYRVSESWVVGASLGYTLSDNDIQGRDPRAGANGRTVDTGSLENEGWSLSLFTSWYRERFYVDLHILTVEEAAQAPQPEVEGVTHAHM